MATVKTVQLPLYEQDLLRQIAEREGLKIQAYLRRDIRLKAKKLGIVSDVK